MSSVIGREGLQVGQWIQFTTEENIPTSQSEKKAIYEGSQRYLVISREDAFCDTCRCNVVDVNGKMYDYCARMFSLNYIDLVWDSEIRVVSRENVEALHGVLKVQAVYQAAANHIGRLSEYFEKYPAQILGKTSREEHDILVRRENEVLVEQVDSAGTIRAIRVEEQGTENTSHSA